MNLEGNYKYSSKPVDIGRFEANEIDGGSTKDILKHSINLIGLNPPAKQSTRISTQSVLLALVARTMKRRHEDIDPPEAKVSSGLHLIQEYDDDGDCEPPSSSSDLNKCNVRVTEPLIVSKMKLKSPSEISKMFQDECQDDKNDHSNLHGGRIRSFAHVRGNWASFLALPFPGDDDSVAAMCNVLTSVLSTNEQMQNFEVVPSPHVSISKTIVFRHHWIEPFIQELKHQLLNFRRFTIAFEEFAVYINDEKTRTFIGMKIHSSPALIDLLKICDSCLSEYKLESYYKDPSFHISLAWIVGDHFSEISQHVLPEVNKRWKLLLKQDESLKFHSVTSIDFKHGNKIASFTLN